MSRRLRPVLVPPLWIAWLLAGATLAADDLPQPETRLWALELGVADVERAVDFYTAALGFEVVRREPAGTWTLLGSGDARLALAASSAPPAPAGSPRAYPNFTVGDLASAGEAVIAAGGSVGEPFETPVGTAVAYRDPFGHSGHLIDHPWDELDAGSPTRVFNVALAVRSVERAEAFYTALGFEVRTRDYLPATLVLEPQGTAQIILHPSAESPADPRTETGALLLDADPTRALAALGAAVAGRPAAATVPARGAGVELRDPAGNLVKLAPREPPPVSR